MLSIPPDTARDLQYHVEIWTKGGSIERLVAATVRSDLGRAAFKQACELWPDREITLRLGIQVLASREAR
jgi:hypothetical protein